ncbi:MAG TPA: hypothetical protein VHW60_15910 [Caulobacteraceae bacterium]|jgi:hypothetical protein|nr:hypothetical protein [Caulobacteraceae bacterium]
MPQSGDGLTSRRRAFVAGAGLVAAAAFAGAAKADPTSPDEATNAAGPTPTQPTQPVSPPPPPPIIGSPAVNPVGRQRDLGKLSNVIYNNPDMRAQFLADPAQFAARLGLRNINGADLAGLRNVFADGFCCMGCGC